MHAEGSDRVMFRVFSLHSISIHRRIFVNAVFPGGSWMVAGVDESGAPEARDYLKYGKLPVTLNQNNTS
jgi:hypothetical protein